jgi:hypothetical protein
MTSYKPCNIINVFKKLVECGVEIGEFVPVDCHAAATALKDATALFLHPLMIPGALNEDTETRARNVVRCIIAGFATDRSNGAARDKALDERKPARKVSRRRAVC